MWFRDLALSINRALGEIYSLTHVGVFCSHRKWRCLISPGKAHNGLVLTPASNYSPEIHHPVYQPLLKAAAVSPSSLDYCATFVSGILVFEIFWFLFMLCLVLTICLCIEILCAPSWDPVHECGSCSVACAFSVWSELTGSERVELCARVRTPFPCLSSWTSGFPGSPLPHLYIMHSVSCE